MAVKWHAVLSVMDGKWGLWRVENSLLSLFAKWLMTVLTMRCAMSPCYGAQNEAYMSRSAEKRVRGLCFNELGVGG